MKIDRLLSMLTILLQKDQTTAAELAQYFDVSPRTIRRDVDDLCLAGIPVVTKLGVGGGISILEGYKVDKKIFTQSELRDILAALRGLDSVDQSSHTKNLMRKLSPENSPATPAKAEVIIDLSAQHSHGLLDKINIIRAAIENKHLISFVYYSKKAVEERVVEPYFITFRWSSWYVFGYCVNRQDFRLFKLNRLWDLQTQVTSFSPRDIPPERADLDSSYASLPPLRSVVILFDKSAAYLLAEEFGPDCYKEYAEDQLRFEWELPVNDHSIGWILSFRDKAEVLSPPELREMVKASAEKIGRKYM